MTWGSSSVPKCMLASLGSSAGRLSTDPSNTPGRSQLAVSMGESEQEGVELATVLVQSEGKCY